MNWIYKLQTPLESSNIPLNYLTLANVIPDQVSKKIQNYTLHLFILSEREQNKY